MSVLDKLDAATSARRTVPLILDSELEATWQQLRAELDEAANQDVQGGSLAMPAVTAKVNEMEELRDRVKASEVVFHFEAIDWRVRTRLQAEHPPRKGNRIDQLRGYNVDTFTPAMIRESCAGVSDTEDDDPVPVPDEKWDRLLGTDDEKPQLNLAQVDALFAKAYKANEELTQVPTSARFLLGSQASGASLAQPDPGKSPRSGSKAGSRRTPRKSTATKKAASSGS